MTRRRGNMTHVSPTAPPSLDRGPTDVPAPLGAPVRRALLVQRWTDLVFLHWRYPAATLAALLPPGLEVDTYDGDAWVGLIPFTMEGVGFPKLAPLPHVGRFPEVNVRTYVRAHGRRAVWFFSLDVDRLAAAVPARVAYRLPYCAGAATHERTDVGFASDVDRRWPRSVAGATTHLRVRGLDEPIDTPFSHFLTDRWRLFSPGRAGTIREAPVEHEPWRLFAAEPTAVDDGLLAAAGLPMPVGAPHAMWSPGVDVRVGRPRRLRP